MKLIKNGSQNRDEATDFASLRVGKDYRKPKGTMPSPNSKNTRCKYGPLKATQSGKR